jgi:hypothetical protein
MKVIEAENVLPVIIGEIAKKELTLDDVRKIFHAIGVAETEIGAQDFVELKTKLYAAFPEIKQEHEKTCLRWQQMRTQQTAARKQITSQLVTALDTTKPLIPQIVKWVGDNFADLRNHYSDEICIAGDLFDVWNTNSRLSVGSSSLVPRLSDELREVARKRKEPIYVTNKKDSEMWHYLVQLLEEGKFWLRLATGKNGEIVMKKGTSCNS